MLESLGSERKHDLLGNLFNSLVNKHWCFVVDSESLPALLLPRRYTGHKRSETSGAVCLSGINYYSLWGERSLLFLRLLYIYSTEKASYFLTYLQSTRKEVSYRLLFFSSFSNILCKRITLY